MANENRAHTDPAHVLAMVELINNDNERIDWDYWAGKMPRWTTYQAVRLMAALDPAKHPDLSFERNETAGAAKEQAKRLELLAASHGKTEASPRDWLKWVDRLNEPVHEGCREAVTLAEGQLGPDAHITIEALGWMISAQDAPDVAESTPDAKADDGLRRTLEMALRLHGGGPLANIAGVIPQIADLANAGHITVHGDEGTKTSDASAISAKPSAYWLTSQDAQHVLASLCPAARRYALTEAAQCIAKRVHHDDYIAEHALKTSLTTDMRKAVERGELPENERRRDGEIMLNGYAVDEWLARERRPYRLGVATQVRLEQRAMMRAGRLHIETVAARLAKRTGVDATRWESTLVDAIRAGILPLKNPRNLADSLPYAVPKNLRAFYDRVQVADVNALLDANPSWQVSYRFKVWPLTGIEEPAEAPAMDVAQTETPEQYRARVQSVLDEHNGNKSAAGRELGITRQRVSQLTTAKASSGKVRQVANTANDPFGQAQQTREKRR